MGDDMTDDARRAPADRRGRLLATKLAAVVREHAGGAPIEPGTFPPGAALLAGRPGLGAARHRRSTTAPVSARRSSGRCATAPRELDLVADVPLDGRRPPRRRVPAADPRVDARRTRTRRPWTGRGRRAAAAAPAEHLAFVADIEAAGAAVVVEHGVVTGEVRGLEVCRVVDVADGEATVSRSRSASAPTTAKPSPSSTATCRRAQALAGVVAAVAAARRRTRPGTRSTAWRRSGCCGGGSNRSRGSSAWRRCARPSRRCRAAGSSTERRALRSAGASTARRP